MGTTQRSDDEEKTDSTTGTTSQVVSFHNLGSIWGRCGVDLGSIWGGYFLGSRSSQNRVTDLTSGGTPRDLLETRCGALQVLSWRFTEDFGCKFDADFVVQSFVAEFLVRLLARIFQMGVRFLGAEGAKPQNRAF